MASSSALRLQSKYENVESRDSGISTLADDCTRFCTTRHPHMGCSADILAVAENHIGDVLSSYERWVTKKLRGKREIRIIEKQKVDGTFKTKA